MVIQKKNLWQNTPGICKESPAITSYIPENKKMDVAVVDDIDKENCVPNAQILCYPVIDLLGEYVHKGSAENLLGEYDDETAKEMSRVC